MNLEGITLQLLTRELSRALGGGKIFKIFMPSRASLLLQVNALNQTRNLLIDMNGASPLITLPKTLPERPDLPPAFCMLLRKHLEEGRIAGVHQYGLDRVLILDVDLIGAERKIITKKLILELTGKNSNIIFTDENGIILDALRHVTRAQSRVRQILPNLPYTCPPAQEGLDFLQESPNALRQAVVAQGDVDLVRALITATVGIGKATAQEVALRSGITGPVNLLDLSSARKLEETLAEAGTGPLDESRIIQETAIYADRVNVTEEMVRLHSHLDQFGRLLAEEKPVGRRMDFLVQEMNREANTIASKAGDAQMIQTIVDMKSEIEKVREQIQNIQ